MSSEQMEACASIVNDKVGSHNPCTGDVEYTSYGYNVREWTAALYVALFGLSSCTAPSCLQRATMHLVLTVQANSLTLTLPLTVLHLIQGVKSRRWYLLGTVRLF